MKEDEMIYYLIAFILGWLVSRMMGNGFSVGAGGADEHCWSEYGKYLC